ncbi:MAG: hypothetical protein LBL59_04860 [Xanthomonadaceae bacterium]|nr:hypothetical protein [Xanthomonadaceae bacterium]
MRFFAALLLFGFCFPCWAGSAPSVTRNGAATEQAFKQTLQKLIRAFNAKDSAAINRLVHPQIGIYVLYRTGIPPISVRVDRLCLQERESDCEMNFLMGGDIPDFVSMQWQNQQLDTDPVSRSGRITEDDLCDMDSMEPGLYIDTQKPGAILSDRWRKGIEMLYSPMTKEWQQAMAWFERESDVVDRFDDSSRHVTLLWRENGDEHSWTEAFVCYLSMIDGVWYLTVLDYASPDCSA